jgi:hypothetical protein
MRAETMGFILLVFAIGALNLGLGYALAVSLGFGPPSLGPAWRLLGSGRGAAKIREEVIAAAAQEPTPKQQTVPPPDPPMPSAAEKAPDPVPEPKQIDRETFRRFVETSVSSLKDFAARLKRAGREDHQRTAWALVAELQGICQPFLEKLRQAAERLSEEIGDEAQEIVLELAAQLETTLSNLHYMNFDSGISAAMERLSQDTGNTLSMACRLQEALDAPSGSNGSNASDESLHFLQVEPAAPA